MSDQESTPKTPVSIYEILAILVEQMSAVSWQKLGLQHDPVTGALETNLAEARVSIDVVAYMVSQIEPQLDDEDKRRIQGIVRDLRINYVQRSS